MAEVGEGKKIRMKFPGGITKEYELQRKDFYVLYDTETISHGDTSVTFFKNPNKDINETNMKMWSSIPAGWHFVATRLAAIIRNSYAVNPANLDDLNNGVLIFNRATQQQVWAAPIALFASPGMWASLSGSTDRNISNIGVPAGSGFTLPIPLEIKGAEAFDFKLDFVDAVSFEATSDTIKLTLCLIGLMTTPITH